MPCEVRKKSRSEKVRRSRFNKPETVGCVTARRSAALVTLRSSNKASNATSRFRSTLLIFFRAISVIYFYDWNYITGQTTLNCIIQRKEMPYDSAANLAGTQTLAVWTTIKWLLHHYKEHRRR